MKKEAVVNEILSYVKIVILALAISFVINKTLAVSAHVPTGSMEDTIPTGSRIMISRLAYNLHDPERGDVISFALPDDESENYLKRIIALPGETIEGIDGEIYIDGKLLKEAYIKEKSDQDFGPYTVPEDSYFVMGDNRNNSWDARYWQKKYVYRDQILGKAEFMFFPEIKGL